MGVHVDESLAIGRCGIYTFCAQGSIYHKIRSLLPIGDSRLRFLQMYMYDTSHEIDNQMRESKALNRDVVQKIQEILNQYNISPPSATSRFVKLQIDYQGAACKSTTILFTVYILGSNHSRW